MSLDPELLQLLQSVSLDVPTPVDWVAMRQAAKALEPMIAGPGGVAAVKAVEHLHIDGPAGPLSPRLYRPLGEAAMTIVHFHGGGWTAGDLDTVDHTVRRVCSHLNANVVSCTYRLAPENPFPAAFDDAVATTRWLLANLGELGCDPSRVAIMGDSAGGNLVAAVTLALRNDARGGDDLPPLLAQLLLYPAVDLRDEARLAGSFVADRDPALRMPMVNEIVAAYVQEAGRLGDWRVSPMAASDLSGLPPAIVVVPTVDPLRDQGVDYATRLKEAGVPCELIEFPHLTHGFAHLAGILPATAKAFDEVLMRFGDLLNVRVRSSKVVERIGRSE